jgi:hypothetical protein
LSANYAKAVPSMAVSFFVYDHLKRWMQLGAESFVPPKPKRLAAGSGTLHAAH